MTGGVGLASMLDDIDPRPIFVDSKDLHFAWCNTAALEELGVQDSKQFSGKCSFYIAHVRSTRSKFDTYIL